MTTKRDVLMIELNLKKVVLTYGAARKVVQILSRGLKGVLGARTVPGSMARQRMKDRWLLEGLPPGIFNDLEKLEALLEGGLHDE